MKYLYLFLLLLITYSGQAQYDTIYLAVMPFTSATKQGKTFVKAAQLDAIKAVDTDYRIKRVDRSIANVVTKEREFQKSEEFLDGKTVEQGKAIGADYVMEGYYDHATKKFAVSIYQVNNGALKCSVIAEDIVEIKDVKRKGMANWRHQSSLITTYDKNTSTRYPGERGYFPSPNVVRSNVKQLLNECFPEKSWAVLRAVSENKSKVKELLIAAGSRMAVTRKTYIEILAIMKEDVDGTILERTVVIGSGKVIKVEGNNFSILKVEDGGKKIKAHLDAGQKLRCRFIKK